MIRDLEFFLAIVKERHFGRAAEVCGVTQPSLSAALKRLESSLGALLINRGARFHSLTKEGELVATWARRIVGEHQGMREELRALKSGRIGHVRIGAIPAALATVSQLTTRIAAKYPNVGFTILTGTSLEVMSMLNNHEVDAALTYAEDSGGWQTSLIPLYRERYRLLVSSDSELAKIDEVSWAELDGIPLCLLTTDMQNRRIVELLLLRAGVAPLVTLGSDSIFLLVTHVKTGKWSSILPEKLTEVIGPISGTSTISIVDPDDAPTIGLLISKRDFLPQAVKALMAEARAISEVDASLPQVKQPPQPNDHQQGSS